MAKERKSKQQKSADRVRSKASKRYTLATFLQIARFAAMIGAAMPLILGKYPKEINIGIIITVTALIEIVLYALEKPIDKIRQQARQEFAYDDSGMSNKFSNYQTLSRKEREALDKERIADAERILSSGEISKMIKQGSADPEEDLKKMIGLPKVKNQIEEMSARMEFDREAMKNKKDADNPLSSMHMLFIGNPGTGKTTVARIMAGFLYKNGYIKHNSYLETDGNTLRGYAQGETSKRTEMILSKAKGRLLFIDEAYAMFSGPDAQEAIATIVKTMENERSSFVLILAGYKKEMKQLIDANSGFFSRFGYVIDFPDYTNQELGDIFMSMAHQNNLYVPLETMQKFDVRIQKERTQKNFGNARTCRNILDKAVSRHALNLKRKVIGEDKLYTLCPEDLDTGIEEVF